MLDVIEPFGVYRSHGPSRKGHTRLELNFGTALLETETVTASVTVVAKFPALMRVEASRKVNTLELMKKLRPHLGRRLGDVCPSDRLPDHVTGKLKFYVVNTDERRLHGDHWVLFYFPK
ncbi:hypothetical protein BOV89_12700 [Solemya velum gill symbiont]|nr:hypothetical protein BOV89_12700 [Solemya velum gill symbiont]